MNHGSLTSSNSCLVKWLNINKCWSFKTKENKDYSHLCMDGFKGGIIAIPNNLEREFLSVYSEAVDNEDDLFILEMRTPVFNFFVDVDAKFIHPEKKHCFSTEETLVLCQIVQRTLKLFYPIDVPEEQFLMIVCNTDKHYKQKEKEAKKKHKAAMARYKMFPTEKKPSPPKPIIPSGNLHLHFPNLKVTQDQAVVFGKAIVSKLRLILGDLPYLAKPWEDVIDPSVYLRNGLRMIGSCKTGKCTACKGKKCDECSLLGRVNLGKVYRVADVILNDARNEEKLRELQGNFAFEVFSASIRTFSAPTPDWAPYTGCPKLNNEVIESSKKNYQMGGETTTWQRFQKLSAADEKKYTFGFKEDAESLKRKSLSQVIDPQTLIFKTCQRLVNEFQPAYKRAQVKAVKSSNTFKYFVVTLYASSEGASYCNNLTRVGKEHNSNTVYFLIKPSGICQKCFCQCTDTQDRKNGLCKDYMSPAKPLVTKDLLLFFPNTNLKHIDDYLSPFEQILGDMYHKAYVKNEPQK